MWVRVESVFVEHPKVAAAAAHLPRYGHARVVAVWLEALCYAGHHATDGFIPRKAVARFHDPDPVHVLNVMAAPDVRLLIRVATGYHIHDYADYQLAGRAIKAKRRLLKTCGKLPPKPGEFSTACGNLHSDRERIRHEYSPDSASENGHKSQNAPRFEFSTGVYRPLDLDLDVQDQDHALSRALLRTKPARRHLLRAAFAELDIHPDATDGDVAEAVKDAAAQLPCTYDAGIVTGIVRAVRAHRARGTP